MFVGSKKTFYWEIKNDFHKTFSIDETSELMNFVGSQTCAEKEIVWVYYLELKQCSIVSGGRLPLIYWGLAKLFCLNKTIE